MNTHCVRFGNCCQLYQHWFGSDELSTVIKRLLRVARRAYARATHRLQVRDWQKPCFCSRPRSRAPRPPGKHYDTEYSHTGPTCV